jgi:ABC-type transporter Mla subunit MlaD
MTGLMNWWKTANGNMEKTDSPSGEITAEELAALGQRGNDAADEVNNAMKAIKQLQEKIKALAGDVRAKEKAGGKPFAKATAKLEQANAELKQAEEDIERLREVARKAKEIANAAWKAAPGLYKQKAMIILFGTDTPYWYED